MAKRSLQASAEGIRKAKQAFKRKGWTQEYLAAEVSLETRQPIWKFFTGQPIDRHVFNDICFVLELEASEIAQHLILDDSISLHATADITLDIDALVQKSRLAHYDKIQAQCSTLQLLDIARPIALNDLYININILEEIPSQRWLEIADLQKLNTHQFNNFNLAKLPQKSPRGIEVLDKYSKLILLGKPGSGKTTFLQAIAISCNQGILQPNCLPIFLNLKIFAEDIRGCKKLDLFNYFYENFVNTDISQTDLARVFSSGRALILLDGLDEINHHDIKDVVQKIRKFTERYYKNKVIITCRNSANYYKIPTFTEVEIADFNELQITAFAEKWFLTVGNHTLAEASSLAIKLMQKLKLPKNLPILQLATTPILLNLVCLVFKSAADFPDNLTDICKKAVNLLLVQWDEARGIKRDPIYRDFSLLHKVKLLSHIAAVCFVQGNNFFPETKMRQLIADYLRQLPNGTTDADALELESTAVLQAIVSQHGLLIEKARGIYSFSHLIFQEYFTAREVVTNINSQSISEIVNHLSENRWRQIFLLSVEMLQSADNFLWLMKQKIDSLAINNAKLHKFLAWVEQKSVAVNTDYHSASVRAFYFTIALPPEHPLACNQDLPILLDQQLTGNLAMDLALDLALTHALTVSLSTTADLFFTRFFALSLALDLRHLLGEKPSLQTSLQNISEQLPSPVQGREALKVWWLANGQGWVNQLRTLMIETRQIGHDWQFIPQDYQYIQEYWDANKLLLDCLHRAGNVTPQMRELIEKNLFMVMGSEELSRVEI